MEYVIIIIDIGLTYLIFYQIDSQRVPETMKYLGVVRLLTYNLY